MIDDTIEQLKDLVAGKLDVNIKREEIDPDAPLLEEGLNLDSLALIELVTLSEEQFGIEFGEDDLNMEVFGSLRALAGVIAAQRASADVAKLSDELLSSHGELLGNKNIRSKRELIQAIKLDLDKLAHALYEVKGSGAPAVLESVFGGSALTPATVAERLADQEIYHVGFEIHEPMSLVLHGIHHWIEHSQQALEAEMKVLTFLRFPASPAFQKRVNAYTEIMRIWLLVNGRTLMLELFDIHRPAEPVLDTAPRITHRNFHGLVEEDEEIANGHPERVARLFSNDEIWHYALYAKRPADVNDLHLEFQTLAARDSNFVLPYEAPVHNPHDDSFHTKIIHRSNQGGRIELEIVTKYTQGAEQARQ